MKDLRQILSSPYRQEDWINFLKKLFAHRSGTGVILQKPQRIELPKSEKVKEAYELGNYETADGRLIGIYQVNISEDMLLYRNKVGLRQLMKNIYKYNVDGVLVVFVQEKKWRLSYISEIIKEVDEKGKIIKEITNEKRFTYLLGEGEKTKTAADRLQLLVGKELSLEDFKNAFAVEALNNDFFNRYKDIYEDFVQHITGVRYEKSKKTKKYIEIKKHEPHPNFDGYKNYKDYPMPHPDSETQPFKNKEYPNLFNGNKKAVRDFVKRMMGRIVFLYFIQKKGWLAVPKGKNWGEGNYDYLYQLYKETPKEDQPYFYEKRLVPLFFECFTDKKSESETNDLRFPYLNGGLFDKTQDQHFDKVNLPYSIFTELFDTFNSYNFTVYEDAPNEHIVAVDPEMLGHIFENLLEDNKDKGAFYTPKEIVHYMCKESLKTFLFSKIVPDNNQSEKAKDVITKIIEHQPLNEGEKSYVKEKGNIITTSLENVKICDPAIGSGAFPMGLLQEIYYIKITLQQLGITPEQTDAQIKKHIIEKNIYGVDIDAGAVDIARLRFWLSLVVDEHLPQPLPNLDFKIMQGNSLLESYQGVDLSHIGEDDEVVMDEQMSFDFGDSYKTAKQLAVFSKINKEQIQKLMNEYFATTENKKVKLKEINDIIEGKIHTKIYLEKEKVSSLTKEFFKKFGLKSEKDLKEKIDLGSISEKGKEYKKYLANKKRLAELDIIEEELLSFQTKIERPYFLWHLYFKEAFDKGGFDIVIGNPPYVQLQKNGGRLAKLYEEQKFKTFARKGDIYSLFYEKAHQLLKQGGICNFITSNKWMRAGYGEATRKFFIEHTNPLILIDFAGIKVFETATVDVNILLYVKEKSTFNTLACTIKDKELKKLSLYVRQHAQTTQFKNADSWVILSDNIEQRIKAKIEAIGTPLKDWDISINYGIKTGFNDAFIINGEKRAELIAQDPKSEEIIRPILRGRDIKRYGYEFADLYLINTHNGVKEKGIKRIDIDDYPAVKAHLDTFYEQLEKRQDKGDTPYNLRNCAYIEDFYKQKIMYSEIVREPQFYLDNEGEFLAEATTFIMTGNNLEYLYHLLHSKAITYFFKAFYAGGGLGGDGYRYKKVFLEKLPIPPIKNNIIFKTGEEVEEYIYLAFNLDQEEIDWIIKK